MKINNIKSFISIAYKFYILDPIPLESSDSMLEDLATTRTT